jgi:acyl-CoA synthetase (AMP-forming)/AMP-acid ligase II
MLPNRVEFVVAWLALARLGAIAVPVNPAFTNRELSYVLNDSDTGFLVIDSRYLPVWGEVKDAPVGLNRSRVIVVGDESAEYPRYRQLVEAGSPHYEPQRGPQPHDLLCIQYTSGTTGFPKGAMLDHRYWLMIARANHEIFPDNVRSILSDHPLFYLDPPWKLVYGLARGATVHFAPRMSSSRFIEWLQENHIEVTYFADPLLNNTPDADERNNDVRLFLGYAYTANTVREIEARFGAPVREFYGSTEAGTALHVPLEVHDEEIIGTCGVPGYGRSCKIVDENGNSVSRGEVGELCVAGGGMFKGYYKRPDINARVFQDGWYRTGDLFCQTPGGYFRFVGRVKDMIRRSGENVSAAEVEAVIREVAGIREVAVTPEPDEYRDEEIKAWLLLEDGLSMEALPPEVVFAHCRQWLAEFKIPRYLAYVDSLPFTPSGKVAKKKLMDSRPGSQVLGVVDRESQ